MHEQDEKVYDNLETFDILRSTLPLEIEKFWERSVDLTLFIHIHFLFIVILTRRGTVESTLEECLSLRGSCHFSVRVKFCHG